MSRATKRLIYPTVVEAKGALPALPTRPCPSRLPICGICASAETQLGVMPGLNADRAAAAQFPSPIVTFCPADVPQKDARPSAGDGSLYDPEMLESWRRVRMAWLDGSRLSPASPDTTYLLMDENPISQQRRRRSAQRRGSNLRGSSVLGLVRYPRSAACLEALEHCTLGQERANSSSARSQSSCRWPDRISTLSVQALPELEGDASRRSFSVCQISCRLSSLRNKHIDFLSSGSRWEPQRRKLSHHTFSSMLIHKVTSNIAVAEVDHGGIALILEARAAGLPCLTP
ncbi:hypothetical protein C8Q70DRAFT_66300 [Cubamyces menziesii]|nr:hypothetical protein C8Q70DRAFT_66300 [Cubamyces menziesii]